MNALPAEHYARLYLRQPWGGKSAMQYRGVLAQINRELNSPQHRCPECEQPGVPVLLSWPCGKGSSRGREPRSQYLMCTYCGHRTRIHHGGGAKPVFTEEQTHWMCAMYQEGMTPREIAKIMSCAETTVRNYVRAKIKLKPRGGSRPLRGVSQAEMEQVRFLYEYEGLTQEEIAKRLGIALSSVQTRVRHGGMVRGGVPIPGTKRVKGPRKKDGSWRAQPQRGRRESVAR